MEIKKTKIKKEKVAKCQLQPGGDFSLFAQTKSRALEEKKARVEQTHNGYQMVAKLVVRACLLNICYLSGLCHLPFDLAPWQAIKNKVTKSAAN